MLNAKPEFLWFKNDRRFNNIAWQNYRLWQEEKNINSVILN